MGLRNRVEFLSRILTADAEQRGFLHTALNHYNARQTYECACCGYVGAFRPEPHMAPEASCVKCNSLQRHRLLSLALQRGVVSFRDAEVLQFAPDAIVVQMVNEDGARSQKTADITPGRAEIVLNIEDISLPDNSFDRIICSHVLEHVNDQKALSEMKRILRPDGEIIIMIPIVEGWDETYENDQVKTVKEREGHFGQWDHVRFFGRDFRSRVEAQGLKLTEFTANGPDSARYGLLRGEKIFIARK